MISLASFSTAANCLGGNRVGREIDGAALVAHVERHSREIVELLERRRQYVLPGVLLHVVAAALGVDRTLQHSSRLNG